MHLIHVSVSNAWNILGVSQIIINNNISVFMIQGLWEIGQGVRVGQKRNGGDGGQMRMPYC